MHDAGVMGRGQAIGNLRGEVQDATDRKWGRFRSRGGVCVRRSTPRRCRCVAIKCRIEHGDDVWMIERACSARFSDECSARARLETASAAQRLQRNFTLQA